MICMIFRDICFNRRHEIKYDNNDGIFPKINAKSMWHNSLRGTRYLKPMPTSWSRYWVANNSLSADKGPATVTLFIGL